MTRLAAIILSLVLLGNYGFATMDNPNAVERDIAETRIQASEEDKARVPSCNDCAGYNDGPLKVSCLERCTPAQNQPAAAPTCFDRLAQLTQACNSATETARNDCDESQNTGLAQAQQAAVVLGQQVSSSVQAACSSMGKISQAANAATAAYQMTCQSSVSSCSSACAAAIQFHNQNSGCVVGPFRPGETPPAPTELKDTQKSCTSLQKKADTAQQAVNNFLNTTMQAQNCAQAADGTSTPAPEICKANPNIAGCTPTGPIDCTKPEMASNKVCICSKNPNDPSCMSGQSTNASNSPGAGGGNTMVRTSNNSDGGIGGDNFGLPDIPQGMRSPGGAEAGVDGKQGSGTSFGSSGGGGGAGSDGKGGHGGGEDPLAVTAGFYGSGGGSSGGGGYGGGSGEGGYGRPGAGGYAGKAGVGPNLRQFLPGGQMDPKARGLAGASGPDGITGPNSNIWQKIQNRYQVVSPSLMP